jgi:hypothetical protein
MRAVAVCPALGEGAPGLLSALLAGAATRRRTIKFDSCLRSIHAGHYPIRHENQAAAGLH